jgi:hypothetical protein
VIQSPRGNQRLIENLEEIKGDEGGGSKTGSGRLGRDEITPGMIEVPPRL